jgi:hypothetical protein
VLFEHEISNSKPILKEVKIISYQNILLAPSRFQVPGIGFAEQFLQESAHYVRQQYHCAKIDLAGDNERIEEDVMPHYVLCRKHFAAPEPEFNQPGMGIFRAAVLQIIVQ